MGQIEIQIALAVRCQHPFSSHARPGTKFCRCYANQINLAEMKDLRWAIVETTSVPTTHPQRTGASRNREAAQVGDHSWLSQGDPRETLCRALHFHMDLASATGKETPASKSPKLHYSKVVVSLGCDTTQMLHINCGELAKPRMSLKKTLGEEASTQFEFDIRPK